MSDPVERLTNLLALLLETPEPLNLHQIASELTGMYPDGAVARRGQFERDKRLLREIGVPIETEVLSGDHAGQTKYWIDRRRYELADLDLDDDERRAVQVAVAATRAGSASAQTALWKLGAGLAEADSMAVAALGIPAPLSVPLAMLRDAVVSRSLVDFTYRGVDRTVEPRGLLLRDGFWYLVAFDRTRRERRTFRVDRIDGEITIGEPAAFERSPTDLGEAFPADPKLIPLSNGDAAEVSTAVVRIDDPQARLLEQHLGSGAVGRRLDNGSIEFVIEYRNPEALRSWVLGFGPDAEVVEPAGVRAEVVGWLTSIVEYR